MSKNISLESVVSVAKDNISCSVGEEAAILHMRSGLYYGLDPVGTRIWNLLKDPRSVEELRSALVAEFEVDSVRCEGDLLALLEKLRMEGLIEIQEPAHHQ